MRHEAHDLPDPDAEFAAEFNREDSDSTPPPGVANAAPPALDTGKKPKSTKTPRQRRADSQMTEAEQMAYKPMQGDKAAQMAMQHADQAKRLMQLEAELQTRTRDLERREASMARQEGQRQYAESGQMGKTGSMAGGHGAAGADSGKQADAGASPAADTDDPLATLAVEFGADFVSLLTAAIIQICRQQFGKGLDEAHSKVDQLIEHLSQERQQNHFQTIAASHKDFMEVVASPAFMEWKQEQDANGQAEIEHVTERGSAQEIIAMLNRFKQDLAGDDDDADSEHGPASGHHPAMAAAEGVRSSGIRLPKAPSAADDFAAAWNEA